MNTDNYSELARKYDYMLSADPVRREFFEKTLIKHKAESLLDCSCGTGSDLIMFNSIVDNVTGSESLDSMLEVARKKLNTQS